ncbi:hypothetical protein ACQJ6S_07200 [Helicobacter pylori]
MESNGLKMRCGLMQEGITRLMKERIKGLMKERIIKNRGIFKRSSVKGIKSDKSMVVLLDYLIT